jgi:hypothetical protein
VLVVAFEKQVPFDHSAADLRLYWSCRTL